MLRLSGLALVLLAAAPLPCPAHYQMLLPSRHSVKKDEAVTFTYQFGHPYEHQLFDAPKPESLVVIEPDGKKSDLLRSLEKISVAAGEGKKVTAYRFSFTPRQRGDYVFFLKTPPIWMEEDAEFLQDTVKVVLHVQAQKGWDQRMNKPEEKKDLEATPLTRPYGLLPGTVFQVRIDGPHHLRGEWLGNQPGGLPGRLVEVERYHATPPKELPADEFITRVVKTDRDGVATSTLPEAGWWVLTARQRPERTTRERDGKTYKVFERASLWVFVDEKAGK
jgi:cobalt/nickel transport protein